MVSSAEGGRHRPGSALRVALVIALGVEDGASTKWRLIAHHLGVSYAELLGSVEEAVAANLPPAQVLRNLEDLGEQVEADTALTDEERGDLNFRLGQYQVELRAATRANEPRPIGDFLDELGIPEDKSAYKGRPSTTLLFIPGRLRERVKKRRRASGN